MNQRSKDRKIGPWKPMYTLVLVLNTLYILTFYFIMTAYT